MIRRVIRVLDDSPVGSLYVHVPFCASKCRYCAFYSQAAGAALIDRYVAALIRELEIVRAGLRPRTVFFGGGTPTVLAASQWKDLLGAMDRLGLLGAIEWTVESNPATVSEDKAKLLRDYGVNRISMGVQSLNADILARLGRVHSPGDVFDSFELLRAAGFDNIGIDLMFAIPGQTMSVWRRTLDEAMALGPEHLSCYELTYEEDTPFFEQFKESRLAPDEDLACAMYDELLETADKRGFHQYEISNFARDTGEGGEVPSRACLHNINYWRGGRYLGLGPSASGYAAGVRSRNYSDTVRYCECLERGELPVESSERLAPLARAGELAAFGLRMNSGWPLAKFIERTGFDLRTEWKAEMERLTALGYARLDEDRFCLTKEGLRFADMAAEMFLRPG